MVDGHGGMLPHETVERLRPALEGSVSGTLLAADEARADAEARHATRLRLINRLFRGEEVFLAEAAGDESTAVTALAEEPFTRVANDRLALVPPGDSTPRMWPGYSCPCLMTRFPSRCCRS